MKCNLFLRISRRPSYYHADTERFLQLKMLKSKLKAVSSMGLRVARHNSGELIHLVGYFSLANTLPFSAYILGL